MTNRLRIATLLAVTAIASIAVSQPAHAQKPTLTQNIDEKGRVPYQDAETFGGRCPVGFHGIAGPGDTSGPTGTNVFCNVTFKAVPTGYRLVITFVSALYTADSPTLAKLSGGASLPAGTPPTDSQGVFIAPTNIGLFNGLTSYIVNSSVNYYVEAGSSPVLALQNAGDGPTAIITGYLVAVN